MTPLEAGQILTWWHRMWAAWGEEQRRKDNGVVTTEHTPEVGESIAESGET